MTETEFEKAFRAEFKTLSNVAFSILRDKDTSKDIVQQVFLKLWNNRDSLSIHSNLQAYLKRSVINTALNYIEKNKKLQLEADTAQLNNLVAESNTNEVNPEKLSRLINYGMDSLPPKCRTVFSLSRYSGLTNKEIAEELDISIKAVEKHIGKALKELRILLKPLYKNLYLYLFFILGVGYSYSVLSLIMVCSR